MYDDHSEVVIFYMFIAIFYLLVGGISGAFLMLWLL